MKRKKLSVVRFLSAVIPIAVVIILLFDYLFGIAITDYAESSGKSFLITNADIAAGEIFSKEALSYSSLAQVSRTSDGNVSDVRINTVELNRLKTEISSEITEKINENPCYIVRVPFGDLFGSKITSGFGPIIPFRIRVVPTVITKYESIFESTGINQAIHRIIITVDMDATAILSLKRNDFSVKTSFVAAETVIVGITPESYTCVTDGISDEALDDLINFSIS